MHEARPCPAYLALLPPPFRPQPHPPRLNAHPPRLTPPSAADLSLSVRRLFRPRPQLYPPSPLRSTIPRPSSSPLFSPPRSIHRTSPSGGHPRPNPAPPLASPIPDFPPPSFLSFHPPPPRLRSHLPSPRPADSLTFRLVKNLPPSFPSPNTRLPPSGVASSELGASVGGPPHRRRPPGIPLRPLARFSLFPLKPLPSGRFPPSAGGGREGRLLLRSRSPLVLFPEKGTVDCIKKL